MITAVRGGAHGREYLGPRIAARLDALPQAAHIDRLSAREPDALRPIQLGLTSDKVAAEPHFPRRTVDAHHGRVHRKLGLGKRWALVRHAIAHNSIGGPEEAARWTGTSGG